MKVKDQRITEQETGLLDLVVRTVGGWEYEYSILNSNIDVKQVLESKFMVNIERLSSEDSGRQEIRVDLNVCKLGVWK